MSEVGRDGSNGSYRRTRLRGGRTGEGHRLRGEKHRQQAFPASPVATVLATTPPLQEGPARKHRSELPVHLQTDLTGTQGGRVYERVVRGECVTGRAFGQRA